MHQQLFVEKLTDYLWVIGQKLWYPWPFHMNEELQLYLKQIIKNAQNLLP